MSSNFSDSEDSRSEIDGEYTLIKESTGIRERITSSKLIERYLFNIEHQAKEI